MRKKLKNINASEKDTKKKIREKKNALAENNPARSMSKKKNSCEPKIVNLLTPNDSLNGPFLSCCELISLLSCLPRYILI